MQVLVHTAPRLRGVTYTEGTADVYVYDNFTTGVRKAL